MPSSYIAPTQDILFIINELAGLADIASMPHFVNEHLSYELVEAILEEAAKLASTVLAPINCTGDLQGTTISTNKGVIIPETFKQAYQKFIEGGWNSITHDKCYGGQGLPELINTATQEMWHSANTAFALCPTLNCSAINLINSFGSPEQKSLYLAKMVSGQWTGTMNLTEPHAGSDLSTVNTRAIQDIDHHRIFGQKIFITWGEHNIAENTIHLVLARTKDAPLGLNGISLFIVPKFLVNKDGSLGPRNDVHAISIERKMGIHASPTCTMSFGEKSGHGAIGYLVGRQYQGLSQMFVMMNDARFRIGLQGLALGEYSYQLALKYAKDRVQGRPINNKTGDRVTIINHPDIKRMLMLMKAQNEAMRAILYTVAGYIDYAHYHYDDNQRQYYTNIVNLLIPVVKGWSTEIGIEIASLGLQIHGGIGYIEHTSACQSFRDARITSIYEGTTGIQAIDLVMRKIKSGIIINQLLDKMQSTVLEMNSVIYDSNMLVIRDGLHNGINLLSKATNIILNKPDDNSRLFVAVDYLMLTGYILGAWQIARVALAAKKLEYNHKMGDTLFYKTKQVTARFYIEHILPKSVALYQSISTSISSLIIKLSEDAF